MAIAETKMGIVEDKIKKNNWAAEHFHNKYKGEKTVGLIEECKISMCSTYAEPLGILAAIMPVTDPTSTTIFQAMMALKTRNCIIFSPHPSAAKCTIEAARIIRDAAILAGAPKNCIGWITVPTIDLSGKLMKHPLTAAVMATGASQLMNAARSTGKPAMCVGPGNNCAIIDEFACPCGATSSIIAAKTFDNGAVGTSEQAVVVVEAAYDKVKAEFAKAGCYIMNAEEAKKVSDYILPGGQLNPASVG
jgi:acetaldehyde dehydrogenase/alcohol dehydrogenase